VAAAYDGCGSSIEVAEQFHCSEAWVRRLIQRRRQDGTLSPRPLKPPDNRKLKDKELAELARLIEESPDLTLQELADRLAIKVSLATVHRATRRLKLPLKKSRSTLPSRSGRM
jgi:transposase